MPELPTLAGPLQGVIWFILGLLSAMLLIRSSTDAKHQGPGAKKPIVQNMLDITATLGLLAGMALWSYYWWDVWRPDSIPLPYSAPIWLIVFIMGMAHPLSLPLMAALMTPSDPINQSLQAQRRRTAGWIVQLISTLVLSIVSFLLLEGWLTNRVELSSVDLIRPTIAIIIILTVIIPSMAWVYIIPYNWRWQLETYQEHARRERRHKLDMALIEAHFIKVSGQMFLDMGMWTAEQRSEFADVMEKIFIRWNASLRSMAWLIKGVAEAPSVQVLLTDDKEARVVFGELIQAMNDAQVHDTHREEVVIPSTISGQMTDRTIDRRDYRG